jgi:hypothetical protein
LQSFSFTRRPHRRRQIANSGSYHPPNLMLKYDTEIIILPKTIITFFWSKAHVQLCNHAWPFPQPSRDQRRVSPCPFYVCMRDPSTQSCFRDPYCAVIRIRLLFLGRCACFRLNVARIQGSERSAAKSSFFALPVVCENSSFVGNVCYAPAQLVRPLKCCQRKSCHQGLLGATLVCKHR